MMDKEVYQVTMASDQEIDVFVSDEQEAKIAQELIDKLEAFKGVNKILNREISVLSEKMNRLSICWSKATPQMQGRYWHWDGSEDSEMFMLNVLRIKNSKGEGCYVAPGRLGSVNPVRCEDYGGLWSKVVEPLKDAPAIDAESNNCNENKATEEIKGIYKNLDSKKKYPAVSLREFCETHNLGYCVFAAIDSLLHQVKAEESRHKSLTNAREYVRSLRVELVTSNRRIFGNHPDLGWKITPEEYFKTYSMSEDKREVIIGLCKIVSLEDLERVLRALDRMINQAQR